LGLVFIVSVQATFNAAIARRRLREGMHVVSYEPAPAEMSLLLPPPAVLYNDACPICLER
jgi:hypothetical protein